MITYFVCKQRNHLNWFILLGKQWPAATWIGLKFIEIENACFNHCNENACAFGGALCSVCSRWFVIFIPFECIFHGHNQFSRVMSKSLSLFLGCDCDDARFSLTCIHECWLCVAESNEHVHLLHPCSITENRWNMMWRYTEIFSVQSNAEIAVFRFVLEATHLVFTTCVEATGDIKFRATHQYKYASDARLKYLSHLVLLTREREWFCVCEFDDFHFGHQSYIG